MAQAFRKVSIPGRKPYETYEGKMQKYYDEDTEEEYAAFLSIAYAKNPEGLKRYQAPEPLASPSKVAKLSSGEGSSAPSTSTYDATKRGKICTQPPHFKGSADCLYLNVFVPKDPKLIEELLPVLVYIHGGGFTYGCNDVYIYPPESIIKHGVVFVTINYRLGLFGFLNTHTEHSPGNAGLKDQVKALEWIRDNIDLFKGDPKNVTLSGSSAGATCVNLHLISPMSQKLFHKAIVQSGGIYSPWGYRGHQREQRKTLLGDPLVRDSLFDEQDSKEFQKDATQSLCKDRLERHRFSFAPMYGPSVETFKKEEAFITEKIEDMMQKVDHDKPVMAGITKAEGIDQLSNKKIEHDLGSLVRDEQLHFRQLLMDNLRLDSETAADLVDETRNRYFPNWEKNELSDQDLYRCYANLVRDIYFHRFYDNFKFGPERTLPKNFYVYRFDDVSDLSAVKRHALTDFNEATHGDEIKYLYCPVYQRHLYEKSNQKDEIKRVINHLSSLWTNFCKTGVPKSEVEADVEWRRHTEENPCFMSISKNLVLIEDSLFREEWAWFKERVDPLPTVDSKVPTPDLEIPRPVLEGPKPE